MIHIVIPTGDTSRDVLVFDPSKIHENNPWNKIPWSITKSPEDDMVLSNSRRSFINQNGASCMWPNNKNWILYTGGCNKNTYLLKYDYQNKSVNIEKLNLTMKYSR